ncbi:MAG: PEP-CTERM sorting domain-containing protein [Phycisphaerales bacterium]|nr:PEP-CTERM sorting domain-containing protein [Phycisphaerales bacterium]
MKRTLIGASAIAAVASIASAASFTMNFDQDAGGNAIAPGTSLTTQYTAWGVSVATSPAPSFASPGTSSQDWATNSSTTIHDTDVGGGSGAPLSGNVLHSFGGWLSENGDPFIRMSFSTPIDSISADFGGIFEQDISGIFGYSGNTLLGSAVINAPSGIGSASLSGIGNMDNVIIVMGSYNDWVGVDNVKINTIPAPASLGLVALAGLAAGRRRR